MYYNILNKERTQPLSLSYTTKITIPLSSTAYPHQTFPATKRSLAPINFSTPSENPATQPQIRHLKYLPLYLRAKLKHIHPLSLPSTSTPLGKKEKNPLTSGVGKKARSRSSSRLSLSRGGGLRASETGARPMHT